MNTSLVCSQALKKFKKVDSCFIYNRSIEIIPSFKTTAPAFPFIEADYFSCAY